MKNAEIDKFFRVNEIFYSIQGEGYGTGQSSVFIRMAGCNLKCDFCDTDHSVKEELTTEEVYERIRWFTSSHLVITGGEPLLQQKALLDIMPLLRRDNWQISIETNGTIELDPQLGEYIHWITMSPKSDTIALKHCDELKVVYWGQSVSQYSRMKYAYKVLQPLNNDPKNIELAINYAKLNPEWRVMQQTHKIMGIK